MKLSKKVTGYRDKLLGDVNAAVENYQLLSSEDKIGALRQLILTSITQALAIELCECTILKTLETIDQSQMDDELQELITMALACTDGANAVEDFGLE